MEINIFYHNKIKLTEAIGELNFNENYNFINLNEIDLPQELIISGLSNSLNKAIFSEYLGILTHKPNSEIVGCFTYSIQTKFSAKWSIESGNPRFLPAIDFKDIEHISHNKKKLFAVELTSPDHLIPREINRLRKAFPFSNEVKLGPFKGSFIISKEKYLSLQAWLMDVTKWMLKEFEMNEITKVHSPFDKSSISNRSSEELHIDKFRHTYGSILERAVAYFLGSQYRQEDIKLIGKEIQTFKKSRDFERFFLQVAEQNDVVISFGNFAYRNVALAWLKKLSEAGVKNYVFIAMDAELYSFLKDKNYNTVLHVFSGSLSDLWIFRLKTISRLLDIGLNVIHSDSDAFWLQNPIDELRSISSDIISSQGTIFPPDCHEKWGFVLCCGFQYFRSSAHTLAFFEQLLPLVEEVKDDQKAINQLLLKNEICWEKTQPSYTLPLNNKFFKCFNSNLNGSTRDGLKVTLLPHILYQRLLEKNSSNPKLLHLLSDKTQEAKLESLKNIEEQIKLRNAQTNQIIWLASYPRSGNTLTRSIFKHNFGLDNYSLYNDKNDIGKYKAIREFVGHKDGDWGFVRGETHQQQIPMYPDKVFTVERNGPTIIKTHSQYHQYYDNFKVIYVVREPRSVLTSYVSYKQNFANNDSDDHELLNELIFDGDPMSGFWSEHVEGWLSNKRENILVLRYEDILSNFSDVLNKISAFIGKEPIKRELASFSEFQKANSTFFRTGKKNSWKDTLPPAFQAPILASCQNQIRQYSYNNNIELNSHHTSIPRIGPKQPGKWFYICTPVFNAVNTIDQTILSIISQEGNFFLHYHIQDGGSTDGTLDKIKAWSKIIENNEELINCSALKFTFESNPDFGMYDAITKGFDQLKIPQNSLMAWINADDILLQGALSTVSNIFKQHPLESWLIPPINTIGSSSEHRAQNKYQESTPRQIARGAANGKDYPFIQQEGVFFTSNLWFAVGGLNTTLKLAGDWDLWRRMALTTEPLHIPFKLAAFRKRPGQLGSNTSNYNSEINNILKLNKKPKIDHLSESRRLLKFEPLSGVYDVNSPITQPKHHHQFFKYYQSKESTKTQKYIQVGSDIHKALQQYRKTGLGSFALEAARLLMKEQIDSQLKNRLKRHFIQKRYNAIVNLIEKI